MSCSTGWRVGSGAGGSRSVKRRCGSPSRTGRLRSDSRTGTGTRGSSSRARGGTSTTPRGSRREIPVRIRTHVEVAALYRGARERYRRLGEPGTFLAALCIWFWETWLDELRQERCKWDAVHLRDRFRCASPGCFRHLCTLHHLILKMLGGDDRWENLLTLCDVCHLENIHDRGSLRVSGEAPDALTFVFGEVPAFVVRGREKRPAA